MTEHMALQSKSGRFADVFDEEEHSSPQLVYRAGKLAIPAGDPGDYFTVNLDKKFAYDARNNLLMDIYVGGACTDTVFLSAYPVAPPYKSILAAPSDAKAQQGVWGETLPVIRLGFSGAGTASLRYRYLPLGGVSLPRTDCRQPSLGRM